jgi:guanylate kinase
VIASISYTTRQPRGGEISGKDYFFIDESEFEAKIADADFLEYVKLYDTYYGTSRQWVADQQKQGKHVFLVIDTQGALKLKGKVPATFIFVRPPSIDVLRDRLSGRQTEPPEMVERRLEWARIELEAAKNYDYLIVNDDLAKAYQVLKSIVVAECHRVR